MQRYARGYLARRHARALRAHRDDMLAFKERERLAAEEAAETWRKREIERRMHPRTAADFEILYNELEAWRLQETRKIRAGELESAERHAAFEGLLHKVQTSDIVLPTLLKTAATGLSAGNAAAAAAGAVSSSMCERRASSHLCKYA
jgi:hypothetical protein